MNPECLFFTYKPNDGGKCGFKKVKGNYNDPVITSGPAVCPCFKRDRDLWGQDLVEPLEAVTSNQECYAICHLTVGCQFFTYDANAMICHLRTGPVVETTKIDFISRPS